MRESRGDSQDKRIEQVQNLYTDLTDYADSHGFLFCFFRATP